MVRAALRRKKRTVEHKVFSAWKQLKLIPNYPLDQVKEELKEVTLTLTLTLMVKEELKEV